MVVAVLPEMPRMGKITKKKREKCGIRYLKSMLISLIFLNRRIEDDGAT